MSLLQQALEKAKQPDHKSTLAGKAVAAKPVAPVSKYEVDHEPRLDSIKFYETLDKKVEEDIAALVQEKETPAEKKSVAVAAPAPEVKQKPEVKKVEVRKMPVLKKQSKKEGVPTVLIAGMFLFSFIILGFFMLMKGLSKPQVHTSETQVKVTSGSAVVPPSIAAESTAEETAALFEAKNEATNVTVKSVSSVVPKPVVSNTRFLLTGITSYESGNFALVNNQVVGVGDRLRENALVKAVTTKSVVLEVEGQEVLLHL